MNKADLARLQIEPAEFAQALNLISERRRITHDLLKSQLGSSTRASTILSALESNGFINKPIGTNHWEIDFRKINECLTAFRPDIDSINQSERHPIAPPEMKHRPQWLQDSIELVAIFGTIAASLAWIGIAFFYQVGPWWWGGGQAAILAALILGCGGLKLFAPSDIVSIGIIATIMGRSKKE